MRQRVGARRRLCEGGVAAGFACGALALAGCAETQLGAQAVKTAVRAQQATVSEASTLDPNEFEARGVTIWDGVTTLQGVWFAHPLAKGVRRVRVRNIETGFEIEGALFRRDPALTGPSILVSSDAAKALGILAGLPAELHIVALADPSLLRAEAAAAEAKAAGDEATTTGAETVEVASATDAGSAVGEDGAVSATPSGSPGDAAAQEPLAPGPGVAAEENAAPPAEPPPSEPPAGRAPPTEIAEAPPQRAGADAARPGTTRRTSLLGPRARAGSTAEAGAATPPSDPVVQAASRVAEAEPAPQPPAPPAQSAPTPQVAAAQPPVDAAPSPERRPDDVAAPRSEDPLAEELPAGRYVQAGSFRRAANAAALARRLQDRGQPARIVRVTLEGGRFSVVLMGPLPGPEAVEAATSAAAAEGITDAIRVNI